MCDNPGAVSRKRPIASATVLGAGSWGTALAIQLARAGLRVRLWARDPAHAGRMRAEGRNPRYLPEHRGVDVARLLERMQAYLAPLRSPAPDLSELDPALRPRLFRRKPEG